MENEANPPLPAELGEYSEIPMESITVGPRLRKLRPGFLGQLTESIVRHGLRTPISVVKAPPGDEDLQRYLLAVGNHRYEAYKRLGRETIPAYVYVMDDVERQLWEIDENLCRQELTELELGEHLQKRKELYEQLHPETRHHCAGAAAANASMGKGHASANLTLASFTTDTATKTGRSQRSVQRSIARVKKLDQTVRDRIRDNPEIANSGTELDALASLKPDQQHRAIELIESGKYNSVKAAKRSLEHPPSAAREIWPKNAGFKTAGGAITVLTIPKSKLDAATADREKQEIIQKIYEILARMPQPDRGMFVGQLEKLGNTRVDKLAACLL